MSSRRTITSPPCRKDSETGRGQVSASADCCGSFLDPQLEHGETCSAEATQGHNACVHAAVVCGLLLADPGITAEPRRLTATQPRPADTPPLSQDTVPPRTCVWSFPMQQRLEETRCRRRFIANCPTTGMKSRTCATRAFHHRPLDGGAATPCRRWNTAVCRHRIRNGQQMSAKSLQRRWKHEIALLRRTAAMTRAILPNPSARAEWLFVGIIDTALHH